jgi:Kef-type K+ transport system membrane component KefB
MPADAQLRAYLRDRLETFGTVLLLPLFFSFTGLRTQIGVICHWSLLATHTWRRTKTLRQMTNDK